MREGQWVKVFGSSNSKQPRAKSEPHEADYADSDDSKGPARVSIGAGGILTELLKQKQPGTQVLQEE